MAQTKPSTDSSGGDSNEDLSLTAEEKVWYQIIFGKNFDEEFPDGVPAGDSE